MHGAHLFSTINPNTCANAYIPTDMKKKNDIDKYRRPYFCSFVFWLWQCFAKFLN
jgi:hypothetical protein